MLSVKNSRTKTECYKTDEKESVEMFCFRLKHKTVVCSSDLFNYLLRLLKTI